jgi:predicted  nucleic acid-binding Zn-ribbon protein
MHDPKQDRPRISTLYGITIDLSDEDANASDSIRIKRDGDSNEIDERDLQDEKQDDSRSSTLHGITIDLSDEYENAFNSIRVKRDGDSNESDESDSQW